MASHLQIRFVEVCSVVACHGQNLPLGQNFESKLGLIMTILNNDSKSWGHQLYQVPLNWQTRFSCSCIKNLVACNSHLRPMEHLNHMHHISVGLIYFYVSIAYLGVCTCSRCFLCKGSFQFWGLDTHHDAKVTFVIFKCTVNGFRSATRTFHSKIYNIIYLSPNYNIINWAGRGYIQLTNKANYAAASRWDVILHQSIFTGPL